MKVWRTAGSVGLADAVWGELAAQLQLDVGLCRLCSVLNPADGSLMWPESEQVQQVQQVKQM